MRAEEGDLPQGKSSDKGHLHLGDAVLRPYLGLESHWEKNPEHLPDAAAKTNDMAALVRGGLGLQLEGTLLNLNLDISGERRQFLGLQNTTSSKLSATALQSSVDAKINRSGAISSDMNVSLVRSTDPANLTTPLLLKHWIANSALAMNFKPGGGALVITAGYGFFYDYYDRKDNAYASPDLLDNMRHMPKARIAWKFLPKTAIYLDAGAQVTRYGRLNVTEKDANGNIVSKTQVNTNTELIMATLGTGGNVTRRTTALLSVGFSKALLHRKDYSDPNLFTYSAEGGYMLGETTKLRFGSQKEAQPVAVFGYYTGYKVFVGGSQSIMSLLTFSGEVAYRHMAFGKPAKVDAVSGGTATTQSFTGNRVDHNVQIRLGLNYQIFDWLSISVNDTFDMRDSNYKGNIPGTTTFSNKVADFKANSFFINLQGEY